MSKFTLSVATVGYLWLVWLASGLVGKVQAQNLKLVSNRVIVKYKNPQGKQDIARAAETVHADLLPQQAVAITVPNLAAVEALNRNPNIEYIEPDFERHPIGVLRGGAKKSRTDEVPLSREALKNVTSTEKDAFKSKHRRLEQSVPYGITMVQADLLDSDLIAAPKTLCIIDSGYDTSHADLPSNVVTGYDDGGNLPWDTDLDGHGTHVAGTIAALDNLIGVVGVTPSKLNLYIVRVFGGDGTWAYSSSLVDAVNRCVNEGNADIISMSLGGPYFSQTESDAFANAAASNVLSIAAAGNEEEETPGSCGYPAGYTSVVSVAAIDESKTVASFSTQNIQVELSAPGVDVVSTIPDIAAPMIASLTSNDDAVYEVNAIDSGAGNIVDAEMVYCETAVATGRPKNRRTGDCANMGAWGKVCLIERGDVTFAEKVAFCDDNGGVGAIIFNNEPGGFYGTTAGAYVNGIPSVGVSDETGADLLDKIQTVLVSLEVVPTIVDPNVGAYDSYSGTSMACPHVSSVAALVWSLVSSTHSCTAQDIRNALDCTAMDLPIGANDGRDNAYGFGLVQAFDAVQAIQAIEDVGTCDVCSSLSPPVDPSLAQNEACESEGGCASENEYCQKKNCEIFGCSDDGGVTYHSCCCCDGYTCGGKGRNTLCQISSP